LRLLLREYNADLVHDVPQMSSVREAIAKDQPAQVNRSRGSSLSPPVDPESNPAADSPQQKPIKLVRAPPTALVTAKQPGGRVSAAGSSSVGGGPRSRNSVVEVDKPRSSRPGPSQQQQQKRRHAELAALGVRGRNILSACMQRVEHSHYAVGSELISVFGVLTQDFTVSFLVQLDKLVQLIESPVFTYLRLQLLDPVRYPELIRALYGLLMMLPQSSAFAILRNRLSTVAMLPGSGSGLSSSSQQQQQFQPP
ncbi:hypothetical protein H4R27_006706, partial [Coemansia aciculifera]